jgi:hypothetical protein
VCDSVLGSDLCTRLHHAVLSSWQDEGGSTQGTARAAVAVLQSLQEAGSHTHLTDGRPLPADPAPVCKTVVPNPQWHMSWWTAHIMLHSAYLPSSRRDISCAW